MSNVSDFIEILKKLRTFDEQAVGYDWKIPKDQLSSAPAQSDIRGALETMFGYGGSFSLTDEGANIVFQFGNAGNWDRFAEFCSRSGISA